MSNNRWERSGLRAHSGEHYIGIQDNPIAFHFRLAVFEQPILSFKPFAVNPSCESRNIVLHGVPRRNYERIEFGIGVDAAANRSLQQRGDLDPNGRMAWNWEVSYKFVLFEGALLRATRASHSSIILDSRRTTGP